ncbi:hypothetical protein ACIKT0_00045 [Hansschlegelia beijingensis]|uniref:hypothetical protein n=1 Tax=Hansschlegelia beijingensis TaxID=1133344 RepID=UPI00387EF586
MRVVLAEDEDSKRDKIKAFLLSSVPGLDIIETRSVRGTTKLFRLGPMPDLLLLDMSLPTFDIAAGEPGGRPQGFGGLEVVRYLERDGLRVPIIVVTQHPAFPKDGNLVDLAGVQDMVKKEAPSNYRGLIYYNTLTGTWQPELLALVGSLESAVSK